MSDEIDGSPEKINLFQAGVSAGKDAHLLNNSASKELVPGTTAPAVGKNGTYTESLVPGTTAPTVGKNGTDTESLVPDTTAPTIGNDGANSASINSSNSNSVPDSAIAKINSENCSVIETESKTTFILCQPSSDPVWIKMMPIIPTSLSLIVSGVALIMTWRTYQYNQVKDAKARAQSIQDDFWIRKVVSPASVEPFLKLVVTLRQTLPEASTPDPEREAEIKDYFFKEVRNLNDLTSGFCSLELIDTDLHRSVEEALQDFDDCLSTYIGSLLAFLIENNSPPPDRADAIKQMNECMLRIFRSIQAHQQELGKSNSRSVKESIFILIKKYFRKP